MPVNSNDRYLSDIDGLRALAVIGVVLFHLQVPGFDGGYVGVDIFFVISGFLITGIIKKQLASGSFDAMSFYGRRIRRLFPAILATVGISSIAALLILQPLELQAFAKSGIAGVASVANIFFYIESGYWDAASALKPLLHLWSLGVEEQFYLLWPALMWLLLHKSKQQGRGYLFTLGGLLVVSFAASAYYTPIDQPAAFYLLPFRIWQFCLGALVLELWSRMQLGLFNQQLLRSLGLLLCCIAFVTLRDGSSFPGWQAIMPSLGAGLVLLSANGREPSLLLSNGPARWLGQVSYSLYLAHWPPIALFGSVYLAPLTPLARFALVAVILVFTLLLHYGVERRFYQRNAVTPTGGAAVVKASVAIAGLMAGVMVAIAVAPARFGIQEVKLDTVAIQNYQLERRQIVDAGCRIDQLSDSAMCPKSLQRPILVIGNSHEIDGVNFLSTALPVGETASIVYFGGVGECGPMSARGVFEIKGDWVTSTVSACQKRLDALWRSLGSVEWSMVLYSSKAPFARNKSGMLHILAAIKKRQPAAQIFTMGGLIATERKCAFYINRYGSSKACAKREFVAKFFNDPKNDPGAILYEEFMNLTDVSIDTAALVCEQGRGPESCETETAEGHPMFVDRHHLTLPYAKMLGQRYLKRFPDWHESLRDY